MSGDKRKISIFGGATGSIGGESTLDLIGRDPDAYDVVALTGGHNIARLAEQARQFNAQVAVTAHESRLGDLRAALSGTSIEAAAGQGALDEAACRPVDWAMSSIVGAAGGLEPGLRVLEHHGTLALANKESLVCAGPLLMATAQAHHARVLPVDSEHSAVFQGGLVGEDIDAVERIIITASGGGAFRDWPLDELADATLDQASSHPNWDMGQRITIDSASMFNKALELIETKEYFGVDPAKIEVLVHPQSLVHAIVGFNDGGMMAHVGPPDMRHAIGYALHWPERRALPVERLDLAAIGQLEFRAPCDIRYPALRLAREVMAAGGMSGAIFNAAKEIALDGFIAGTIGFMDMAAVVEEALDRLSADTGLVHAAFTLDNVRAADQMGRVTAQEIIDAGL